LARRAPNRNVCSRQTTPTIDRGDILGEDSAVDIGTICGSRIEVPLNGRQGIETCLLEPK
jgi:hypothetical protein